MSVFRRPPHEYGGSARPQVGPLLSDSKANLHTAADCLLRRDAPDDPALDYVALGLLVQDVRALARVGDALARRYLASLSSGRLTVVDGPFVGEEHVAVATAVAALLRAIDSCTDVERALTNAQICTSGLAIRR
ncbi:hypothetical protein [Rhodococcus sovatensis]|uniref:Uncharacterized protein n=1 Tax=Rhodococcus sovatensis TaxID=1805840 RepID=A0ABZ2PJQ2_9NOCA